MDNSENGNRKKGFWNFIDNIEGDKIVWIIVFMLIIFSILAIFSSTPLLALQQHTDRISIMKEQIAIVAVGLGVIFGLYSIKKIGIFRIFSQLGFFVSLVLLIFLVFDIDIKGVVVSQNLNEAQRTLEIFKLQVHVYEVVKVAMIMYLAWALHAYKKDLEAMDQGQESGTLWILNRIGRNKNFAFLKLPLWKRIFYLYLPIAITAGMILPGSNSSMLFISVIMVATLLLGGLPMKEIIITAAIGATVLGIGLSIYFASDKTFLKPVFSRIETGVTRMTMEIDPKIAMKGLTPDTPAYDKKLGQIKQPNAALIAIHEGGLTGKGPGNSTQKYAVPVMFGDYIFSFLVEEYGLLGGIFIIILYVSLLARGSTISRNCDNQFAKTAVGGLSLLITGQAFMHMMVNVGIGPLTGQTLPLISHGSSSFLMFSVAFGIILSISRMAKKKIQEEELAAKPIYESERDDIQAALDTIEEIDS
ncbi:MAG: FtsW/RodA/SpoVE family cell cycle protein [Bacteroidales bacterium]|nr:FtsW/RodA/SpoVE family cell cycle protein [Bacteroidales bacterium]